MYTVNLEYLGKMLPLYFKLKKPLYLWGKPSTAKSSIIRQFAIEEAAKRKLEYSEDKFGPQYFTCKIIPLSQFDAPDLRGMPEIKNGMTTFIPGCELPRDGQGIIFFDEMNLADEIVRKAMYQYILEGRYSNLPPIYDKNGQLSYWRVAASNEESDFSNVGRLRLALLRRFHHLKVVPESKEILDYFSKIGANSMVIAYLLNYPTDLFPHPYDEKLLEAKANPFPCMWEAVSDYMLAYPDLKGKGKMNDLRIFVSSSVGLGAAAKFIGFLTMATKLKIKDIIKDPKKEIKKIDKEDEKISLLYAVIASLQERWVRTKSALTPQQVEGVLTCLDVEFQTAFLKLLMGGQKGKRKIPKLLAQPGVTKAIQDLGIYLNDDNG